MSFVEHSPSTEIELKLSATAGRQELEGLAGLERIVRRDDREHRRQVGVDHPGALGHPSDGEAGAAGDGFLRPRVGRQDRLGRVGAAAVRERGRRLLETGKHPRERERHADHAGREDEYLLRVQVQEPRGLGRGCAGVELAAQPGGCVRDARVGDDGLRLSEAEVLLRDDDRRRLDAVGREHRRPGRGGERANHREVGLRLADPAVDAAGDEAPGCGHAHTSTPPSRRPAVSSRPSARLAFWIAWPAAPFPRLSSEQTTIARPVAWSSKSAELCDVGALDTGQFGNDAFGEDANRRCSFVSGLEAGAQVVFDRLHVTRHEQAPANGEEVRDEADREAERLLDLRRVLVRAHAVGRQVLEHEAGVGARSQAAAGSRDARLGVDDHAGRLDRVRERCEREERRRGVAAGIGDQRAGRRPELGKRVAPARQIGRLRMLEAVPVRVCIGVAKPVAAGEIDDDRVARRVEQRRLLGAEAREHHLGVVLESLGVRDERRKVPVQADVERGRRVARQRVRPERHELELRVREHPVEGLLAGVAGATEDRRAHLCVLCIIQQIMQKRPAHLVLEDGTVFTGRAVGAPGLAAGEACFTTSMAGYEEAVTDPSYVAQVLCFSYPLVGNYGVDPSRFESERVQCEGVVVRRARPAFAAWLAEQGVVALEEVDTRALVRRIRDGGVLRCALGEASPAELHARALAEPPIDGRPLDREVGTREPYARRSRPARDGPRPGLQALDSGAARRLRPRGLRRPPRLGRRRAARDRASGGAGRERAG